MHCIRDEDRSMMQCLEVAPNQSKADALDRWGPLVLTKNGELSVSIDSCTFKLTCQASFCAVSITGVMKWFPFHLQLMAKSQKLSKCVLHVCIDNTRYILALESIKLFFTEDFCSSTNL